MWQYAAMREAAQRWAIERVLNVARAVLARDPSPPRIRALTARAAPFIARRESFEASEPVEVGEARAWWIQPAGVPPGGVILYFHGGGFIAEARAIHDPLLAAIGRASGARGFMVDYRLAPEHPFPAATEDCFAAWNYLLSSGIDPGRIVFAGDSAGGNLAVVTAMRARDEGMPQPAAIILVSPLLDLTFGGASMERNDGIDPMFRAATMRSLQSYYGTGLDLRDPRLSPLFGRLNGLPPMMLLVGSSELLLDDTLRFAARVAGAKTSVWHGMPHVFPAMRGLAAGDRAIREIGDFIRDNTSAATMGAP
ncbi:MAG: alpha/beta hydrolase [Steroidobacteraceae bacterium]